MPLWSDARQPLRRLVHGAGVSEKSEGRRIRDVVHVLQSPQPVVGSTDVPSAKAFGVRRSGDETAGNGERAELGE